MASGVVLALVATACNPGLVVGSAGDGTAGYSGDAGPATAAQLDRPVALATLPDGSYYVVDEAACVIRRIDATKVVTTVAGTGTCGYSGDGGPATAAEINPGVSGYEAATGGIALDTAGNLYLADSGNSRLRRIDLAGTIDTVAGDPTVSFPSVCSGTEFAPGQVTVTPAGDVFVSCGGGAGQLNADGSLTSLRNEGTDALTSDGAGLLYLSFGGGAIHRLDPATLEDVFLAQLGDTVTSLTVDAAGNVYATAAEYGYDQTDHWLGGSVTRIGTDFLATRIAGTGTPDPLAGVQTGAGTSLSLTPVGVAVTAHDGLVISSGHVVYRLQEPAAAPPAPGGGSCDTRTFHHGFFVSRTLDALDLRGCDLAFSWIANSTFLGTNLAGVHFDGSTIINVDFTGATGNPPGGATATWTNTTCPDGVVVSAPDTCVGHGFGP